MDSSDKFTKFFIDLQNKSRSDEIVRNGFTLVRNNSLVQRQIEEYIKDNGKKSRIQNLYDEKEHSEKRRASTGLIPYFINDALFDKTVNANRKAYILKFIKVLLTQNSFVHTKSLNEWSDESDTFLMKTKNYPKGTVPRFDILCLSKPKYKELETDRVKLNETLTVQRNLYMNLVNEYISDGDVTLQDLEMALSKMNAIKIDIESVIEKQRRGILYSVKTEARFNPSEDCKAEEERAKNDKIARNDLAAENKEDELAVKRDKKKKNSDSVDGIDKPNTKPKKPRKPKLTQEEKEAKNQAADEKKQAADAKKQAADAKKLATAQKKQALVAKRLVAAQKKEAKAKKETTTTTAGGRKLFMNNRLSKADMKVYLLRLLREHLKKSTSSKKKVMTRLLRVDKLRAMFPKEYLRESVDDLCNIILGK